MLFIISFGIFILETGLIKLLFTIHKLCSFIYNSYKKTKTSNINLFLRLIEYIVYIYKDSNHVKNVTKYIQTLLFYFIFIAKCS